MSYNSADWMREVENFSNRIKDYFENVDIRVGDMKKKPGSTSSSPSVDLLEDETNLYLVVELPGMRKEDIRINLSGDRVLSISGTKNQNDGSQKRLIGELWFGSFNRSVNIPDHIEIDSDRISASYTDGVLRVTLPKSASSASRPIEII